jgi:hypothetical protein
MSLFQEILEFVKPSLREALSTLRIYAIASLGSLTPESHTNRVSLFALMVVVAITEAIVFISERWLEFLMQLDDFQDP